MGGDAAKRKLVEQQPEKKKATDGESEVASTEVASTGATAPAKQVTKKAKARPMVPAVRTAKQITNDLKTYLARTESGFYKKATDEQIALAKVAAKEFEAMDETGKTNFAKQFVANKHTKNFNWVKEYIDLRRHEKQVVEGITEKYCTRIGALFAIRNGGKCKTWGQLPPWWFAYMARVCGGARGMW